MSATPQQSVSLLDIDDGFSACDGQLIGTSPAMPPATPVDLGDFNFSGIETPHLIFGYEQITFSSAEIDIQITNQTVATITGLNISMRDSSGNELLNISDFSGETIGHYLSGSNQSMKPITVANCTLPKEIYFVVSGHINIDRAGLSGTTLDADAPLDFKMSYRNYNITGITTVIDENVSAFLDETIDVPFDNSAEIYKATIADINPALDDYKLTFTVSNSFPVALDVALSINNLILASDVAPFNRILRVEANTLNQIFSFSLDGATIGDGLNKITDLHVALSGNVDTTADAVTMNDADLLDIAVSVGDSSKKLSFSHLDGMVPDISESISDTMELDIPSLPYMDRGLPLAGNTELVISCTPQLPLAGTISLTGYDKEGNLLISLTDKDGNNAVPFASTVTINNENSNILAFISKLPASVEYSIFYNNTAADRVDIDIPQTLDVTVRLAAELALDTGGSTMTVIPTAENGEPLSSALDIVTLKEAYYNAYRSGSLKVDYLNTLGVAFAVDLIITDHALTTTAEALTPGNDAVIVAIPMLEATDSTHLKKASVNLTKAMLEPFLKDAVYLTPRLHLQASGQQLTGKLDMSLLLDLVVNINQKIITE
jgi:hypothetical protein